jgi:hypothetical protein
MKHARIIVNQYGGPETLEAIKEEIPEPKNGQVRIKVLAAGVALPDVMMREGFHPRRNLLYPSPQVEIWSVWWIAWATASQEFDWGRPLPRCRLLALTRNSFASSNANSSPRLLGWIQPRQSASF